MDGLYRHVINAFARVAPEHPVQTGSAIRPIHRAMILLETEQWRRSQLYTYLASLYQGGLHEIRDNDPFVQALDELRQSECLEGRSSPGMTLLAVQAFVAMAGRNAFSREGKLRVAPFLADLHHHIGGAADNRDKLRTCDWLFSNQHTIELLSSIQCSDAVIGKVAFTASALECVRSLVIDVSGFDYCAVDAATFREMYLANSTLENVTFNNSILDGIQLDGAALSHCYFGHCTFDGADFSGATFYASTFLGCRFNGIQAIAATLRDCKLIDCEIRHASFQRTYFDRLLMYRSAVPDASAPSAVDQSQGVDKDQVDETAAPQGHEWFERRDTVSALHLSRDYPATISHSDFRNTGLHLCHFYGIRMTHVDWQNARFDDSVVDADCDTFSLRGLQAALLAEPSITEAPLPHAAKDDFHHWLENRPEMIEAPFTSAARELFGAPPAYDDPLSMAPQPSAGESPPIYQDDAHWR